jgi:hypothetical protein
MCTDRTIARGSHSQTLPAAFLVHNGETLSSLPTTLLCTPMQSPFRTYKLYDTCTDRYYEVTCAFLELPVACGVFTYIFGGFH